MVILVVDTCETTHGALVSSVEAAYPDAELLDFFDPLLALKYGANNHVDILVTAVNMRGLEGPALADLLGRSNACLRAAFISSTPMRRKSDREKLTGPVISAPVTAQALLSALGT